MAGAKTPISSTSKRSPVAIERIAWPRRNAPSTTRTKAITPRYWSYTESMMSARGGASGSPCGGGMRSHTASSTAPTLRPLLAEMRTTASGLSPSRSPISAAAPSGSAAGRSILLTTGMISRLLSIARCALATVCASTPCAASTTSSAPSQAASERETSYVKSTCPGVSMRFRWYVSPWWSQSTRTACALIVIPRSRSMSMESSTWSRISRSVTAWVISRMRSASVDLPWSMCAMIEKLRMRDWSIADHSVPAPSVGRRRRTLSASAASGMRRSRDAPR